MWACRCCTEVGAASAALGVLLLGKGVVAVLCTQNAQRLWRNRGVLLLGVLLLGKGVVAVLCTQNAQRLWRNRGRRWGALLCSAGFPGLCCFGSLGCCPCLTTCCGKQGTLACSMHASSASRPCLHAPCMHHPPLDHACMLHACIIRL